MVALLSAMSSSSSSPKSPRRHAAWSELHEPLLLLVYDCLPLGSRLRFGRVCRSWRRLRLSRPLTPPLLMLPPHGPLLSDARSLWNPFDGLSYSLSLPGARGAVCCASAHGWLLFAGPDANDLFLLHALSKARVDLPPLLDFPLATQPFFNAALSRVPTDPACAAAVFSGSILYSCGIGDAQWRADTIPGGHVILDLAACGGDIYVLSQDRRLGVLDTARAPALTWLELDGGRLPEKGAGKDYIVESSGELFLVTMDDRLYFRVFRADLVAKAWVGLNNLGDRALFLGPGCSLSVPTGGTGWCGNRIHFAVPPIEIESRGERRLPVLYMMDGRYGAARGLLQKVWSEFFRDVITYWPSISSYWIVLDM